MPITEDVDQEMLDRNIQCLRYHEPEWELIKDYGGGNKLYICRVCNPKGPRPEQKPEVKQSKERIRKATEMFNKHFDEDGFPKTDEGERLTHMYERG
jgi:hypothetical protein